MMKQEQWKRADLRQGPVVKSSQCQQLDVISRTETHIQVTRSMAVALNSVEPPAHDNVMSAE